MKKTLVILALVLLSINSVLAFGIAPSSTHLVLDEDKEFAINIINRNKEEMTLQVIVEGPMKDYIEIDKETIQFFFGQERERINVKVNAGGVEDRGLKETRISFAKIEEGRGDVSARVQLSFVLRTIKPYEGSFVNVEVLTPNFERGKRNNFVLKAENQGNQNALNVIPVIDIVTRHNENIETIRGDPVRINAGESHEFILPYTPDIPNGEYFAVGSVVYSGAKDEDTKTFKVGEPRIAIDSISTSDFRIGGIANFNLVLKSEWGREISGVFAEVEFFESERLVERTRTFTTDVVAYDRTILPIYWDTTGMTAGVYRMKIELNYLNQKQEQTYTIELDRDDLRVVGVGLVTGRETLEDFDYTRILMLVLLLVVGTNGFLIYHLVIKKKREK